jgi:hypothetical protein
MCFQRTKKCTSMITQRYYTVETHRKKLCVIVKSLKKYKSTGMIILAPSVKKRVEKTLF